MQKETEILNDSERDENSVPRATLENQKSDKSDGSVDGSVSEIKKSSCNKEVKKNNSNSDDFEDLIKGPYKDAFAKKVQSIINKRFKEQKNAESKSAEVGGLENPPSTKEEITVGGEKASEKDDLVYQNLITAGVDSETAYRVLHFNEFMDSSMRYGAELAAKQLADSIRQKAARPTESAISQKGYTAKTSVSTLTPEKRKELAKKALMGEQIGF